MAPLPCSAMACTGFRQVLPTDCDFQRLLLCLGCTFTFPRAAEGSFSCQQNFSTSQSKINREPYWHKHPPEERISPFLSENALVRVYEAPREKNHNFFIKKLKDSRKKEPFISASLKNNVCIVLQIVYTLFGESKSQRKDKEYISE